MNHFARTRSVWYALPFLLASFTGCSCQTEDASMANPEAIHQAYNVKFDGTMNVTNADARYRFGGMTGTNLRLDGVAGVKHNGAPMKEATSFGVHYVASVNGFQADHAFEYTDTAGKIYKNSIRLVAVDFPADLPAEFSRNKALKITFVGDAVEQGERVEITIRQKKLQPEVGDRSVQITAAVGAKEFKISDQEMQQFAEGDATMILARSRNHELQNATSRGGSMSAIYTTAQRKIVIVK